MDVFTVSADALHPMRKSKEGRVPTSRLQLLLTTHVVSKLNPLAPEFCPVSPHRCSEEFRCLFITFSNGQPLRKTQISRFFSRMYGACVERVYVHQRKTSDKKPPPLFGKVTFTSPFYPRLVLRGEAETHFIVDGKPLRCKRFDSSKRNRRSQGNDDGHQRQNDD